MSTYYAILLLVTCALASASQKSPGKLQHFALY